MPYLSRILLNPLRQATQRLLSNPQRMHAAVEGVLPPAPRKGRLLWRLETAPHAATLLVVSPDRPTLDHLVEQAGWADSESGAPRIADLEPALALLAKGREFEFRATLNPSYASTAPQHPTPSQQAALAGDGRARRLGHRTVEHQLRWFTDRAAGPATSWGFSVGGAADEAQVQIVGRSHVRFSRRAGAPPVEFDVATYQGKLTVTDPERLRMSILDGIGRVKAYGCGLITLAPTR